MKRDVNKNKWIQSPSIRGILLTSLIGLLFLAGSIAKSVSKNSSDDSILIDPAVGVAGLLIALFIVASYWFSNRSLKETAKRLRRVSEELELKNSALEKAVAEKQKSETQVKSLNEILQTEVQEKTRELLDAAYAAGMAEIATGVLHNVGNVLSGASVSAEEMLKALRATRLADLKKANELLQRLNEIPDLDEKLKKLPAFYEKLSDVLTLELEGVQKNAEMVYRNIKVIENLVESQQKYAKKEILSESLSLEAVVEESLILRESSNRRHKVRLEKRFEDIPKVVVQKSKLIHILLNLFKNAVESMDDNDPDNRVLGVEIFRRSDENAALQVKDNGKGIRQSDLDNIFQHGFTTKKNGHGFGLHTCANYMSEMGGKIRVKSEGPGKGAVFTLEFVFGKPQ